MKHPVIEFITSVLGGLFLYVISLSLGMFGAMALFWWLFR